MSVQQAEVASKRLELLRKIVPGLAKLAILFDATYPTSAREAENVQISTRKADLSQTRPSGGDCEVTKLGRSRSVEFFTFRLQI